MALQDDLKAAIEKNLSAEVGATLKKLLEKAEADASALALSKMSEENLRTKLAIAQEQAKSQEAIEARIKAAKAAELDAKTATIDKRVSDLIQEHAKDKVAMMQGVVMAVFANSRFKYDVVENGSLPAGMDQYGNTKSAFYNRTATGTGEGAPPPPPTGTT